MRGRGELGPAARQAHPERQHSGHLLHLAFVVYRYQCDESADDIIVLARPCCCHLANTGQRLQSKVVSPSSVLTAIFSLLCIYGIRISL